MCYRTKKIYVTWSLRKNIGNSSDQFKKTSTIKKENVCSNSILPGFLPNRIGPNRQKKKETHGPNRFPSATGGQLAQPSALGIPKDKACAQVKSIKGEQRYDTRYENPRHEEKFRASFGVVWWSKLEKRETRKVGQRKEKRTRETRTKMQCSTWQFIPSEATFRKS